MSEDKNIVVAEGDIYAETFDAASNITSVVNVLGRDGYFPTLVDSSTFVGNVIDGCDKDFSDRNIIDVAFSIARLPHYVSQLPKTGLYKHPCGGIFDHPYEEKPTKKKKK
ncbi:hypothetical protein NVP2275O_105 [Vibrio phage 2.275.O._10N.286.54.E11]|nr:hypothetical protein NVP2275O_105 [Vibrio phage 2.275.O._10N.286.54.E11]